MRLVDLQPNNVSWLIDFQRIDVPTLVEWFKNPRVVASLDSATADLDRNNVHLSFQADCSTEVFQQLVDAMIKKQEESVEDDGNFVDISWECMMQIIGKE